MHYVIMERMRFPGYFYPLPNAFLQAAEIGAGLVLDAGRTELVGSLRLYTRTDAERMIEWLKRERSDAEYLLYGYYGDEWIDRPRQ